MVPGPRGSLDYGVRDTLVATSSRLHVLWEEAATERRSVPDISYERECWDDAARRLVDAMEAMERVARMLDPSLGRRDWRSRCVVDGSPTQV